jgi:hypothetical protein
MQDARISSTSGHRKPHQCRVSRTCTQTSISLDLNQSRDAEPQSMGCVRLLPHRPIDLIRATRALLLPAHHPMCLQSAPSLHAGCCCAATHATLATSTSTIPPSSSGTATPCLLSQVCGVHVRSWVHTLTGFACSGRGCAVCHL